ncbi:MAG: ABC transporter substrate-binding protein [Actinomycetota bacterium]
MSATTPSTRSRARSAWPALAVLMVLALVAAACGSDGSADEASGSTSASATAETDDGAADSGTDDAGTDDADSEEDHDDGSSSAMADTEEGFPVTIVDSRGRELTFESRPERVVALWNDGTGKAAYVGADLIATGAIDVALAEGVYGPDAGIEVISSNDDGPDWEQIVALEPDLVIAGEWAEETIGADVAVYIEGSDWEFTEIDEYFYDVNELSKLFGTSEEVAARNEALIDRATAYGIASGRELTIFNGFENDETGNAWWFNDGGISCQFLQPEEACEGAVDLGGQWYELGLEGLLEVDPDVILVEWEPSYSDPTAAMEALTANPIGAELSAVKNDRFVRVEKAYARPSHPIVFELYVDYVMPLAYPDLFPEPLTDDEVADILASN